MYEDEIPVGRAKDITGQRFGKWTVLYRVKNKNRQTYWKVRCDCGTEKSVYVQTLLRGESRSCGCDTANLISKALKEDLTGQVFGYLTALEEDTSKKRTSWLCQCKCGKIISVQAGNLKTGHTKSCGCGAIEATKIRNSAKLQGEKFGKLTVIEEAFRKNYSVYWKCQCECGNFCNVTSGHLISGHTQSCGCLVSQGELKISTILNMSNISFTTQQSFETCRYSDSKKPPRFDFYVKDSYLIEYDGKQHFEPIEIFGGEEQFIIQQYRDEYKNKWCKDNNIPLIRIPYTKLNTLCIEDLMLETTQFRVV